MNISLCGRDSGTERVWEIRTRSRAGRLFAGRVGWTAMWQGEPLTQHEAFRRLEWDVLQVETEQGICEEEISKGEEKINKKARNKKRNRPNRSYCGGDLNRACSSN
jgi:hypothetical protein